jgi:hypothetical protein
MNPQLHEPAPKIAGYVPSTLWVASSKARGGGGSDVLQHSITVSSFRAIVLSAFL